MRFADCARVSRRVVGIRMSGFCRLTGFVQRLPSCYRSRTVNTPT